VIVVGSEDDTVGNEDDPVVGVVDVEAGAQKRTVLSRVMPPEANNSRLSWAATAKTASV
jgi:hypothetical protein